MRTVIQFDKEFRDILSQDYLSKIREANRGLSDPFKPLLEEIIQVLDKQER